MQEFILKNLITIIFIFLLILGFLKGFNEGLLKKVLSFATIIITIILTRTLTPIATNILKDTTNIEATLTAKIYDVLIKSTSYDSLNIPFFNNSINTGNLESSIRDGLCTNIANTIINLLCAIVIFILLLILIKLIIKVLDIVDYIPIVGQLNKILGGALGVLEVILIVSIVFTILKVLENSTQVKVLTDNIKNSPLVGYIYEHNIVYSFFANLFSAITSKT